MIVNSAYWNADDMMRDIWEGLTVSVVNYSPPAYMFVSFMELFPEIKTCSLLPIVLLNEYPE